MYTGTKCNGKEDTAGTVQGEKHAGNKDTKGLSSLDLCKRIISLPLAMLLVVG
jgi:hypothetical protein